jgi:EAL domain-containing protein (putative c-di-GMP-specific phosphodiesterase class I)/GGDEF domain-containing protein
MRPLATPRTPSEQARIARFPQYDNANELDQRELMAWIESLVRDGKSSGFALLVINLRRSDRAAALMLDPTSLLRDATAMRRMAEALRPQDRFARVGPEEIVAVLPNITDVALVTLAVNRLLRCFDAPLHGTRMRPCIGCSFQIADKAFDIEALLTAADAACTEAQSAENSFAVAESCKAEDSHELLLAEMQGALYANELEVWFQPQLDIASGSCCGVEALLRWHNKRLGQMVSPALLAELAETSGIMHALTTYVLNATLRQAAELRRAGLDVRTSVNLSPSLLRDVELPELIAQSLATWCIAPDRLAMEVTENAMMVDTEHSLQVMHALKQLGVRLSIDGFGTGYSSLAYLQRMPLDELKIDRVFVQKALANVGDAQIVRSVIDLAHNFDLEAVAEGVEDRETFDMLANLGCDVVQGYLYARPMPAAQMPSWHPGAPFR